MHNNAALSLYGWRPIGRPHAPRHQTRAYTSLTVIQRRHSRRQILSFPNNRMNLGFRCCFMPLYANHSRLLRGKHPTSASSIITHGPHRPCRVHVSCLEQSHRYTGFGLKPEARHWKPVAGARWANVLVWFTEKTFGCCFHEY